MLKKLINAIKSLFKIKDKLEEALPSNKRVISDEEAYNELEWVYGGFHGEGATYLNEVEIANLSVKSNGLSYSWIKGGCENLGANGAHNASETIACLFCKIDGRWLGGKFDWISTTRTTRDFHNIETGYHGWDAAAINKAVAFRFLIISKSGKWRTNVISQEKAL